MLFSDNFLGESYKKGDWKKISIHDENNIKGFFGDYRFLSNVEECIVVYEDMIFYSSENAYQAAKLINKEDRIQFKYISPVASMKLIKTFNSSKLKPNWNNIKYSIMLEILTSKFLLNQELKEKLLATNNKYLEETNWWKDNYWGYSITEHKGQNNLGKILMKIRAYWK